MHHLTNTAIALLAAISWVVSAAPVATPDPRSHRPGASLLPTRSDGVPSLPTKSHSNPPPAQPTELSDSFDYSTDKCRECASILPREPLSKGWPAMTATGTGTGGEARGTLAPKVPDDAIVIETYDVPVDGNIEDRINEILAGLGGGGKIEPEETFAKREDSEPEDLLHDIPKCVLEYLNTLGARYSDKLKQERHAPPTHGVLSLRKTGGGTPATEDRIQTPHEIRPLWDVEGRISVETKGEDELQDLRPVWDVGGLKMAKSLLRGA